MWFQLLQLLIGSTAVSMGVLLGIFMGGMCLGSLLLPMLMPKKKHPLRVYVLLEIGIAFFGVLILACLPLIQGLYGMLAGGSAGIWQRALIAALCLLPPTALMGATLPAVARWVESTSKGVSWLGFFYGGNIAGAVLGCLLAGFYLLRVFDMAVATYVAAAINVLVAALAYGLSIGTNPVAPKPKKPKPKAITPGLPKPKKKKTPQKPAYGVWCVIALSGASALGSEVVWTRLLSLLMGGTVYTFSIILAVFLVGLGIGSSVGSLLARNIVNPLRGLAVCQFMIILGIAWTGNLIARSIAYWPIDPTVSSSIWYTFQLDVARCMFVVLPATICWGASFPLALASAASPGQDPARLVGRMYAANTLGAILGAVCFSVFLVPKIGTLNSQFFLLGIGLCSVLLTLLLMGASKKTQSSVQNTSLPSFGTVLVTLICGISLCDVPWGMIGYGRYSARYERFLVPEITPAEEIPQKAVGERSEYCLMTGEGINVSVAVTQTTDGIRKFHGGGKVQASSSPEDMRLQRMLGHLPALIHDNPEDVLVVACGAGVTAGSFLPHPEVKHLVICDIEPLVPTKVTPYFSRVNFNVVDPKNADRVLIEFDDGRHFIRTTDKKFDIITSDPIDPWVKGCAALNTIEYYQMCRDRLKPGGIMALWMPLYESDPQTLKSVIATFFEVFPDGILWTNDYEGEGYDAVLFGQVDGTQINLDEINKRYLRPDHETVRESMRQVGFEDVEALLATYAGSAKRMKPWTKGAQVNRDINLRLQYLAGMSLNSYMGSELLDGILKYYEYPKEIFQGSPFLNNKLERLLANAGRTLEKGEASSTVVQPNKPATEDVKDTAEEPDPFEGPNSSNTQDAPANDSEADEASSERKGSPKGNQEKPPSPDNKPKNNPAQESSSRPGPPEIK
ncbi:MAG: fused MFS/spermidine synthase [Planctomycetota bacterium]